MKWKLDGRAQPLPDETFLPYCSKSKHWGLYVLRRSATQDYSLDCFLPTKAKPEAFDSTTRYIASTFRVKNNVTTHMPPDEGLHDASLFWYFYASFWNKYLDDSFEFSIRNVNVFLSHTISLLRVHIIFPCKTACAIRCFFSR